jgi:hypothetical protein
MMAVTSPPHMPLRGNFVAPGSARRLIYRNAAWMKSL